MHVFLFEILVFFFVLILAKKGVVDDNKPLFKNSWLGRKNTNSFHGVAKYNPFRDGSHAMQWVSWVIALFLIPIVAFDFPRETNFIPLGILTCIIATIVFQAFYHKIFKPKGK